MPQLMSNKSSKELTPNEIMEKHLPNPELHLAVLHVHQSHIGSILKMNKIIYSNCKKDNTTKKSGLLRKKQTFLLKPGLAGSSVSYIPPKYTELAKLMGDLSQYLNENVNRNFISVALSHYQFEKLHPYLSGNGLMGRLLIPIETSYYKNEPPLLFISESLYNLKNKAL